jgi:hypothetical protein
MRKHPEKMICLGLIAIVYLWLLVFSPVWAEEDQHVVGLWRFNEDEGEVVADSSGKGLDSKQINCEWTDGKFDSSALRFNKADSHVVIPYNEALDLQVFTIEFWTKFENPPTSDAAFMSNRGWQVGDKMTGFTMRSAALGAEIYLEVLTKGKLHCGKPIVAEDWLFIAVTYDANDKIQFYMNGELKTELTALGEFTYADEELWIGAEPGLNYAFGGLGDIAIDEVRISDIVRTQEEIKSAMETGYGQMAVSPSLKLPTTWGALK